MKEEPKGEDWENACHELLWLKGDEDLFYAIQALAEKNRDERLADKAADPPTHQTA